MTAAEKIDTQGIRASDLNRFRGRGQAIQGRWMHLLPSALLGDAPPTKSLAEIPMRLRRPSFPGPVP